MKAAIVIEIWKNRETMVTTELKKTKTMKTVKKGMIKTIKKMKTIKTAKIPNIMISHPFQVNLYVVTQLYSLNQHDLI